MRVRTRTIPSGRAGTLETLRAIFAAIERGQVDPPIIRFTRNAIRGTDPSDERQMVRRIVDAWLQRVQVLEDSVRHEFIQDAAVTLSEGFGDCDDLAAAVGASIEHVGIPVELVVASNTPGGREDFTHVWLRAFLQGEGVWLPVDPRAMAELGFRLGQELPRETLTALETFAFNEDRGTLEMGQSLGNQNGVAGVGQPTVSRRERNRRRFPPSSRPFIPRPPAPAQRTPGTRAAAMRPQPGAQGGRPRRARRKRERPLLSRDVSTFARSVSARQRARTLQDRLRAVIEAEEIRPAAPGRNGAVPLPSDTIRQLQREAAAQMPGRARRFSFRRRLGVLFPFIEATRTTGEATATAGETVEVQRQIVSERERVEAARDEKADTFVKRAGPPLAILTALFLGTGILRNIRRE